MSDEEQDISNEEEEDEEEDEEEGDQEDQDDEEDQDEDEDEDDQDQDGDDDQEDDEQDQDGQDQDQENQDSENEDDKNKFVPTFKHVETEEFKFRNLLADISSIGNSVDHFINSLPSHGGSHYRTYQPKIQYIPPRPPVQPPPPIQQPTIKYTVMKDEDIQVSMQPQIVVQQTLVPKQEPKKQPYKISNESTKFLAQLYEENKKLKRWQNSQIGSSQSNGFYNNTRSRFERPEHERGLINIQDRNRQIDEAIEMLRRQDYT